MEPQTQVTFGDVAGIDRQVELNEVGLLEERRPLYSSGGKILRCAAGGGTGKTLLARAVAGEACTLLLNLVLFVEMFVGVASRVRDLFEQAGKCSLYCVHR